MLPYVAVGDCYQPGDFMSCLRDARMVGASIDNYATHPVQRQPGMVRLLVQPVLQSYLF